MHSAASENIVLVAPRPVRITANSFSNFHSHSSPTRPHSFRLASAPPDAPDRLKPPEDENDDAARSTSDKDLVSVSPRGSPRSSLPSEALEEFLSILRPSLFPPQSPTLIARRIPLTFAHERPTPLSSKPLDRLDNVPVRSPVLCEDVRTPAKQTSMHLSPYLLTAREEDEENDTASEVVPFRMFGSGPLASPISRIHTRNPFQRHPSYEMPFKDSSGLFQPSITSPPQTPAPTSAPNSPALVPLPPPTPNEMDLF